MGSCAVTNQEVIMSRERTKPAFRWEKGELSILHCAYNRFTDEMKLKMGLMMQVPVYLQDPWVAKQARQSDDPRIANRTEWEPLDEISVPCEPDLARGPTSSRITVVDYDSTTRVMTEPAEWDEDEHCFYTNWNGEKVYLTQENCDMLQFHQVNVWAVVQKILDMYEQSTILGRYTPWAFEGSRLRLVPHAGEMSNAFYSRQKKSIEFYYFHEDHRQINTCLSHDIIAHETGHAILDGLRPFYIEDSSIETSAFHECAADMTAIMAALLNNELRFQAALASDGDLSKDEIISGLAEEFSFYAHGRPYLRSAQDADPMDKVQGDPSQYHWSQVLTGTMFKILKEMVSIRMLKPKADGKLPSMKEAFTFSCNRFRRVAFQPFDFLPPVDVRFSDYARAVLRADQIAQPCDEDGYREIMKRIFKEQGIDCDEQVPVENLHFYAFDIDRITRSRMDAYHFLNANRRQLCIPEEQDIAVVDLYQTDKMAWGAGHLPREVVIQYIWREDVPLKGREFGRYQDKHVALLCGGTLIFDSRGNVISWQHKPGTGKQESSRRIRGYCKEEQVLGNQRRVELLNHIRERISSGAIQPRKGNPSPLVGFTGEDGFIHLQTVPHLRHWDGKTA